MKVLITGSAGFVGRHLRQACEHRGDDVVAIDIHDGYDAMGVFRSSRHQRFDLVLHCAAFVGGRRGIDGSPARIHAYNTMLDAALFDWAIDQEPGHIVYFSSSAAYPAWMQEKECEPLWPLTEDCLDLGHHFEPETTYGEVKLAGERMARSVRAAGIPVTVLRPFSGYGEDQSLDYPFPAFIARARARQDPFEIWGTGSQVRDWVHIDDIVGATLAAVEHGIDGPVNICTGIGTAIGSLAHLITKAAGYYPRWAFHDDKPAGVDYRVGDPTAMRAFYEPTVTLQEGIARALVERHRPDVAAEAALAPEVAG